MAKFAELTVQLELQSAAFQKGMDSAAKSLAKVQASAKQTQSSLAGMEKGLQGVTAAVGTLAAAFGALKGLQSIVKAGDDIRNLQGSFTALLGDAGKAGDMLGRVFAVAAKTGAPLADTASSMQRLTIAMQPLGASNEQIAQLAENFIKLGKVGGSSAEDTGNALKQLSQGLASGALGGDELKSIRENVPLVAKAIADGMGVSIGELKGLGEQGKLTADVVANALLAATAKIETAFRGMPESFEQAANKVETRAANFMAELDNAGNISTTLVRSVTFIGDQIQRWHAELVLWNSSLSQAQTIADVLSFTFKLINAAFVGLVFGAEQIAKYMALWVQYGQALANLDWSAIGDAKERFNEQFDAARRQADQAISDIMAGRGKAAPAEPFGPPAPAGKLKPLGATGGAGKGGKSDTDREAEALKKMGDALAAAVDPLNAYNQKMIEYNKLIEAGAISSVTYSKAVEAAKVELTAHGDALTASVDPLFEYELKLRDISKAYRDGAIEVETYVKLQERLREEMEKKLPKSPVDKLKEGANEAIASGIGDFFHDIVSGSMTAEQAFEKMVRSILADLAKLLAEFLAAQATKFIIKTLFGGVGATGASAGGASASAASFAAPGFNAAASIGLGVTPLAGAATTTGATAGAIGTSGANPWQVTINNNAPGVDVRTATAAGGGLEVTIEKVRAALANDVARGGNQFSRALEGAYSLGRGR